MCIAMYDDGGGGGDGGGIGVVVVVVAHTPPLCSVDQYRQCAA
jgi:hypothetical protein